MTFKLYFKKFVDGVSKPVICNKSDDYHLVDFSILKDDTPKNFNPESTKNIDIVKSSLTRVLDGEILHYKDCYSGGDNTITWHFAKSAVIDGEVQF
jgi:hypothetical protein